FKEDDQVLLATRNLPLKHAQMLDKSERPKLVPGFIGPFEIVQAIDDNAMRLKLHRSMSHMHDVFNVGGGKALPIPVTSHHSPPDVQAIDDNAMRLKLHRSMSSYA
ncbi:hypothetical protein DYB34_011500, partial [Aphanomyces astaci]